MDERILFDRFHEALDPGPRPGGFDRMRSNLISKAAAARPRRAFRMRFSKMGFRLVAALAAAAIVIALAAVLVATHHTPTGMVNAGPDQNTKAYRVLIASDYNAMNASTSNSCNAVDDTTCPRAVAKVAAALQKWIADLEAFRTPEQYVVLDGQLRRHLSEAVVDLEAAVGFQKTKDANGFNLAVTAAEYERGWMDPASFELEGNYQYTRLAGSYKDVAAAAKQSLGNCVNGTPAPADFGCARLMSGSSCPSATVQQCENDLETAATQLQAFIVELTQYPAPSSDAANAHQFLLDIAKADTALLAIRDALLKNDPASLSQARNAFGAAISAARSDALNV